MTFKILPNVNRPLAKFSSLYWPILHASINLNSDCMQTHTHILKNVLQGTNAMFQYELADTVTGVPFRINPTSGLISVSGPLDYETTTSYSFTVSFSYCGVVEEREGGGGKGGGGEGRGWGVRGRGREEEREGQGRGGGEGGGGRGRGEREGEG